MQGEFRSFKKVLEEQVASLEALLRDCYSYIAHDTPATDEMLKRISEMRADNLTFEERKEWAKMVLKLRQALGISVPEAANNPVRCRNCKSILDGITYRPTATGCSFCDSVDLQVREGLHNHELIAAINAHQANPNVHPLTCGNDSNHTPLLPMELEGRVVLACKDCDYIQKHIPPLFPTAKQDPIGRMHEECDDCLKQDADPPKCKGHPEGPVHCMEFDSAVPVCGICGERHYSSKSCKQDDGPYQCGCGHIHRPSERCGPY